MQLNIRECQKYIFWRFFKDRVISSLRLGISSDLFLMFKFYTHTDTHISEMQKGHHRFTNFMLEESIDVSGAT